MLGHEDCLYLDVYSPPSTTVTHTNTGGGDDDDGGGDGDDATVELKPVMVWLFGGAFVLGDKVIRPLTHSATHSPTHSPTR